MMMPPSKVWAPDEIVIPPHGLEIRSNGRPNYAKALGLKSLASVTGVIGANNGWSKDALMYWANRVGREHGVNHREFTDSAARIGTMGHAMVEAHLKGRPIPSFPQDDPDQVPQAQESYQNFCDWFGLVDFSLIASEYPLVSKYMVVGGTIDIMGLVNGKITLIDIKTSNGVYEDHKVQVAAYQNMWNEKFTDYQIQKVWILQIAKDKGGFAHYQLSDMDLWRGLTTFCLWRILDMIKGGKSGRGEIQTMIERFTTLIGCECDTW